MIQLINKWSRKEVGVWIDGTYGLDHARAKLWRMVYTTYPSTNVYAELIESLKGDAPDGPWDEDEALDALNDACEDGLSFEWYEGDLMLVMDEWREE